MDREVKKAIAIYEGFHRFAPKKIGEFHASFKMPSKVNVQGKAVDILYRSDKIDPETLKKPKTRNGMQDYIHDHDSKGVKLYLPRGPGETIETPDWIRDAGALSMLGFCLGFKFDRDGKVIEAKGTKPLPELYTTANGKCLVIVQDKRDVLALVWGGKLDVEPRGIVG
jgi:hypothetical protein